MNESVIASASEDDTVRLWKCDDSGAKYTAANCCRGHEAEVLRLNFSPDATLLASGVRPAAFGIALLFRCSSYLGVIGGCRFEVPSRSD